MGDGPSCGTTGCGTPHPGVWRSGADRTQRAVALLVRADVVAGRGAGGEIQLTDAISALIKERTVLAYRFDGKRYDCGSKLGYLEATLAYGLKHPETAEAFRTLLQEYSQAKV